MEHSNQTNEDFADNIIFSLANPCCLCRAQLCVAFSEQWLDAPCLSKCELEVDIAAADILNRLDVCGSVGGNPGLTALWDDERQRRRQRGDDSQEISPPSSPGNEHQRRRQLGDNSQNISPPSLQRNEHQRRQLAGHLAAVLAR